MTKYALASMLLFSVALVAFVGRPAWDKPPASGRDGSAPAAAEREAGYGVRRKPPLDPVRVNGPIFKGWRVPKLAVVITGEQLGYLEPCGCSGLDNQKGGLRRRHSLFKQFARDGWPTVAVDVGGLVKRFGRQTEIMYQTTVAAMRAMGYAAIGFGPKDLKLPGGELVRAAAGDDPAEEEGAAQPSPFVSANVDLLDFVRRYVVVEAGGLKVGITSILGDEFRAEIRNDAVVIVGAEPALGEVVPQLVQEKCDYLILLAHARPAEAIALARRFPAFHLVVAAGGVDEPPEEVQAIEGTKTLLVEVGHKGMYAVVVGLFDDKRRPVRYQAVPLDARFEDSPEMTKLLAAYQKELELVGWAGLGLRPAVHPRGKAPGDPRGRFVGSEKCGECHESDFQKWTDTPHVRATETLTRLKPARQFDPECISCHSTGWDPQEYRPYEGGFASLEQTPHLVGNGCENCHGPGASHVDAEEGDDAVLQERLRDEMRITLAEAEEHVCAKCHDVDNSPEFLEPGAFERYWHEIEHGSAHSKR